MAEKLGLEGIIAYNTGTFATPTWNPIDRCRDLRTSNSKSEADFSSRKSRIKVSRAAMIELGVEFDIIWDPADADCTWLHDAYWLFQQKEFFVADGPVATAGTKGIRMTCEIFGFDQDEPLEEGMKITVSLKPCPSANAPAPWTVP